MEEGKRVITIVCTGNVCRSPMGEQLLTHALAADPAFEDFKVISAGTSAFAGEPASRNSALAMKKVGLDLSDHRSRPLSDQVVEISDLILTMTSGHKDLIHLQYPDLSTPVKRFREWIVDGSKEVPDPFGGPLDLYQETRDALVEAIPPILEYLRKTI